MKEKELWAKAYLEANGFCDQASSVEFAFLAGIEKAKEEMRFRADELSITEYRPSGEAQVPFWQVDEMIQRLGEDPTK